MEQKPRMAYTAEMYKAAEPFLQGQPFSSTGAKEFDKRLRSRADPVFHPRDHVKKGKRYGRIIRIYDIVATVRWIDDQSVSDAKLSSLTKV